MHAKVGDEIKVKGRTLGQLPREGEILDVAFEHGSEHYRVRWDDGHESTFFPGGDVEIIPVARRRRTKR